MFSFKRFFKQFKIDILQNAHRHGLYLLIICLLFIYNRYHVYHYLYSGSFESERMMRPEDFVKIIMIILGVIDMFISIDMFRNLSKTNSGINYLMMPATTLEKYLAAWAYSTLFTFVIYIIAYFVIDRTSMFIGNLITGHSYQDIETSIITRFHMLFFKYMIFFQSFFFLGAVLFRKNSFIKTTATLFFFTILISIISNYIIKISNINVSSEYFVKIIKTIFYIIPFICWSAGYLKLKNTQI